MSESPAKLKICGKDSSIEIQGSEDFVKTMAKKYRDIVSANENEKKERKDREFQICLYEIQRKDQQINRRFIISASLVLSALFTLGINQVFFVMEGKYLRYDLTLSVTFILAVVLIYVGFWRNKVERQIVSDIAKLREKFGLVCCNSRPSKTDHDRDRVIRQRAVDILIGALFGLLFGIVSNIWVVVFGKLFLTSLSGINLILYFILATIAMFGVAYGVWRYALHLEQE